MSVTLSAPETLSTRFETMCNDPERSINRSISWFKNHLTYASTVELTNHTGTQEVQVKGSGEKGFTFDLNGKTHQIQYPRAGYMKLAGPGKLQFLKGFNGEVLMECKITSYTDGSIAPDFADYPHEEEDYGRKKRKKTA